MESFLKKKICPLFLKYQDLEENQKKQENHFETLGDFTKLVEGFGENFTEDFSPIRIGENLNQDELCLVFSSKNLLKNIILQAKSCSIKYMCIDCTCSCWNTRYQS